MLDQVREDGVDLRLQMELLACTAELTAFRVERELSERVDHTLVVSTNSPRRLHGMFKQSWAVAAMIAPRLP
jgi:hypothetical protein